MCQISENKLRSSEPKLKEIKSKVFADFKPPKLIRYQSVNGSKQKISIEKRSLPSRSNSTLSSNGLLDPKTFASRSTSSTSVTSQIIQEEDRMSDCTLKDNLKKTSEAKGKELYSLFKCISSYY